MDAAGDAGVEAAPAAIYRRRLEALTAEEARWSARSRAFSLIRLAVFVGILAAGFMVVVRASSLPVAWLATTGGLVVIFVTLVLIHDRVIRREARYRELAGLNRQGLARLDHDWDALPPHGPLPVDRDEHGRELLSPLARDLHLFGHASLFQLLGAHLTPPGRTTLTRWLLNPAAPERIRGRQEAVAELGPLVDLRQELARRAAGLAGADPDVEPFLDWAEGEPWLLARPGRRILSFLLPVLTAGAFAAWATGLAPGALVFLGLWLNFAVSHLLGGPIHQVFDRISSREGKIQHYATVLEWLDGRRFESALLSGLTAKLETSGLPASRQMEILHQRVVLSDSRHSAPLNFILQTLLLWDFHVLALLERWQVTSGRDARRWFEALGELEALAALAGLRFENPRWAFPEIHETGPASFQARELAHPLLPPATRVANDVELGPTGTFLLVTGSNMSGKSTLLRAVGVNVVLAQAGAPVCARALRMPPLALGTSILIEDSLEDGISFFMAELLRLRDLVEVARRCRREGRTLLYLLDEVLRGTNSRERRLAAQSILHHLLSAGAIGAISTHDPALLESEELAAAARPVYFRETIDPKDPGERVMTFDYRLREGVSPGGNALKLLELVGL